MDIDELIARLIRLGEESPRGSATEVLLRYEGDMRIEGASLGRAQLPHGRSRRSPVVIIQASSAHRSPMRGTPGRREHPTGQDLHAGMVRTRLCRAIAKKLDEMEAATGERSRPLDHLLRVIEAEGTGRADAEVGQLRLFDDHAEGDFARALAICEATGAVVIHSGSGAVYYPPNDRITIPLRKRFYDPAAYFNVRFRMTALWAERRIGWEGTRAEGELISVLAAHLLAEAAGIPSVEIGSYRGHHEDWHLQIRSDAGFLDRVLRVAGEVANFILAMGDTGHKR